MDNHFVSTIIARSGGASSIFRVNPMSSRRAGVFSRVMCCADIIILHRKCKWQMKSLSNRNCQFTFVLAFPVQYGA